MSIFAKSNGTERNGNGTNGTTQSRGRNGLDGHGEVNIIGKGVVIDGDVSVHGDVRVGGRINGDVSVDSRIVVANDGIVVGSISTSDGDVAGHVEGDLNATGQLIIRTSACVIGTVRAKQLTVEHGAALSGLCEVGEIHRLNEAKEPITEEAVEADSEQPSLLPME